MAKSKSNSGVQNRAIYSRASYLYQAASYLACRANEADAGRPPSDGGSKDKPSLEKGSQGANNAQVSSDKQRKQLRNMSRRAISEMRAVTLKTQIRQSQALKRTVCKFCDTLQVEAHTCRSTIENPSRGGLKPWADVLVMRCRTCGNAKRFPVSAPRQKRMTLRSPKHAQAGDRGESSNVDQSGQNG
ncbi:RNAse P rpr2/Rpp21/SNM1 subunit [Hirsutella rhossiliensis]|uniref:RNAse P rpr2/Rpp21/SNM1 subunit domain-containing protein n=1 Tax=Hirsutella rhossiliensis TaxID=111463 RepID=A0A9P8SIL4_9HYPO|nr:RNAse P rpr2/Rpp21/SNM1 subunit domain-containing protein [Hirsutella rhossiliensis]KAH0964338.1 RNAse P rpr2/Rpp21/SNM1 subunit domain-containing protein [Hirsutella rhossiliensis]